MGWAQKAYDDDKDEWNDIKKEYKITEVLWDVYSQEARFVRALIKKTPGLRGKLLKLDVYHEVAKQKLYNDQFLERKQLIEALAVLEKLAWIWS